MKGLFIISCLFFIGLSFTASAQTKKGKPFSITGAVKGIDSGLIYARSLDNKIVDSAVIRKGSFALNGTYDQPGRRIIQIQPGNWMFPAFVDVPQIKLDIDTAGALHQFQGGKDYPMITSFKETGSPLADAYDAYKKDTGQEQYLSLASKLKLVGKDSAAVLMRQMDAIREAFPAKGKQWTEQYISANPSSFPAVFIFQEYFHESRDKSPAYLQSMLAKFNGPARESAQYESLNKELATLKSVRVGNVAPDFTLEKVNKGKLKLSSTRGSVVMLDFWASWCVPCRAGIPNWKKVYSKYHPKGFNILSIADDRKRSEWIKALNKEKMPWMQVIDSFPDKTSPAIVGELYGLRYIPYFVLLDKEGVILAASGDETVITRKLEEIYK